MEDCDEGLEEGRGVGPGFHDDWQESSIVGFAVSCEVGLIVGLARGRLLCGQN
jgi:hypothetical protein